MIWIRADGNSEIGTGHIMRCLSVAEALERQGSRVCFLLADAEPAALLERRGQSFMVLHTDYRRMEEELPRLSELFSGEAPQLVLIDSYFVTERYLRELKAYARTAYLDDKCLFDYPVNLLVNYNIYGKASLYGKNTCYPDRKMLLGPAYAPLREEFRGQPGKIREKAEKVLITTGGSDKYNLAGKILKKALEAREAGELPYLSFHVVSGLFNKNLSFLEELSQKYPGVEIYRNVTRMAELMKLCDMAVTAGGSTMYELCAVGVPILCFSFVDNQEQIVETFKEQGLVCYGGNYLKEGSALFENVVKHLGELAADWEARRAFGEKERQLVDGLGAERLSGVLKELYG